MSIYFKGSYYIFRKCDVKEMTEAHVIAMADSVGEVQYGDPNGHVWLFIRGIGYGMRKDWS